MDKTPAVALLEHFASLPDPRMARHRWHNLSDILVIAVCAVLCGAESFPASADFGHEREEWLRQFLELPQGIPSHDIFNRIFRLLDPVKFQACFLRWMQAVAEATQGEVVAINGKALRRSFDKGRAKRAIHPHGQCLGHGEWSRVGTAQGGRKIQWDHRHSRITGPADPQGVYCHD